MQGKPDFSSMKVKLSNRLGTRDEQGSSSRILHTSRMENRRYEAGAGEAEQCKGNGRFFSGIFSFGYPGSWGVLAQSMPAKQVLWMIWCFYLSFTGRMRGRAATCDLNKPHKATKSRGEKKSPIIVLISLFCCPFYCVFPRQTRRAGTEWTGTTAACDMIYESTVPENPKNPKSKPPDTTQPLCVCVCVFVCACVSCCNLCWLYSSSSLRVKK